MTAELLALLVAFALPSLAAVLVAWSRLRQSRGVWCPVREDYCPMAGNCPRARDCIRWPR